MRLITDFEQAKKSLTRQGGRFDYTLSQQAKNRLEQIFGVDNAQAAVTKIIHNVQKSGDAALYEYNRLIDGVETASLEVQRKDIDNATSRVSRQLMEALETAAGRIEKFHRAQREAIPEKIEVDGCFQIAKPLDRVGVYAPGGTACYPSSVLMTAIPARCAGVTEILLVSPPGKDGAIPELTLAAANIAGIDRVFSIGGAQAIAALAYGTSTIPGVDKICGPGNLFVMLAKKQVFGVVDIDGLQGPSEVMIVADSLCDPENIAHEILAQAEHDALAQSILITDSRSLADAVYRTVESEMGSLNRAEITGRSIEANGAIIIVDNLELAIELVNNYAPEHLVVDVNSSNLDISRFRNAGCIFTGKHATVVMGDYIAGPSHALPTGGTARFSSPLNVNDFIRYYNVVNTDDAGLRQYGPVALKLAQAEGLTAHARALEYRLTVED